MRLPPISTLFPYTTLFRSEIDRDAARRHLKSGVDQRRADALATLFDGTGGESDDRPVWQPSGGVNLIYDVERIDDDERGGTHSCEHSLWYRDRIAERTRFESDGIAFAQAINEAKAILTSVHGLCGGILPRR